MKTIVNTVIAVMLSITIGSITVYAQQDTRTPGEKEYEFRDSLFRVIAWKMGQVGAAKASGDQAAFKSHMGNIAYMAGLITEGFQIPNNAPNGSLALPAIWEDFDNFSEKADNLINAASALAASGDMDAFDPRKFGGGNCGGCHRDHKQRDD
jgi:cytochrome c556